jgi:sulfotransferase family protein
LTRHLLVIGGQRCGTTGLQVLLDAHPDITMARPARPEPKVFMSEELAARGLDWYEQAYFAHATTEAVLGEKSTSYIEDGAAAARAAAVLGQADIVVQLRDPVARAVSNWRFSSAHGLEERPLTQALEENLRGPRAWDPEVSSVSPFAYLERGRYVSYLQPWFASFPGRVHVRFLEDLVTSESSVSELYDVLGVDPSFRPPDQGRRINESSGPAPEIGTDLQGRLRAYFHDSDVLLRERLGRELPWPER